MVPNNKNKGYVLLEMIIYVALFSIMIGGLILTSFLLMQNAGDTSDRVVVQEEMNFVLKKIDWVLTSASSIDFPTPGVSSGTLQVTKNGIPISIVFDNANHKITLDGEDVTTVNVTVNSLSFETIAGTPKGVKINLNIEGQTASFNKYLKI